MKPIDVHRIAEVLILSGSELREETIKRYTEFVINLLGKCNSTKEIITFTKTEFDITLNVQEVESALSSLKEEGRLLLNQSYWSLTEEAVNELEKSLNAEYDNQFIRFDDFEKSFIAYGSSDLTQGELNFLFSVYNEYIIECIFIYGKLTSFTAVNAENSDSDLISTLNNCVKKIRRKELKISFESFIKQLPDCLTLREVTYIETLSNRAENFFSLGLSKELAASFYKMEPFNWVILLDTNILYSILKIREHSENPAVQQLFEIFFKWRDFFKVSLRFLPATFEELKLAKGDLENKINKTRLTIVPPYARS